MRSKTANVIHYLVSKHDGRLGRTALVKLLYMLDLEARRYLGHQVTDFTWRYYDHGPFPAGHEFYDYRDALSHQGVIREERQLFEDANVGYRYWDAGNVVVSLDTLTPGERAMVGAVDRRYGNAGLQRLLDAAYASEPMHGAQKYERLPMERADHARTPETQGIDFEALAEGIEQYERDELIPWEVVERELLARLRAES